MTTSTKELKQVIAKEKTNAELAIWLDGLSTGDMVYYTEYPNFHEAAQRLRKLDKPDCVWTPLITTVETNVNFYKQPCVTNIMVREMPTKLTSFCPNCGGAVKSGGTPNE